MYHTTTVLELLIVTLTMSCMAAHWWDSIQDIIHSYIKHENHMYIRSYNYVNIATWPPGKVEDMSK